MSTATTALPHVAGRDDAPGLGRLTHVELRKMYDTRAGFWLLLSCVALMLLVAVLTVFTGADSGRNFSNTLGGSVFVVGVLLPVVGILLVTSEWSQRTAQVTFTLVPQRGRILAAKLLASVVLAVAAFAVALALSAFFVALGGTSADGSDVWSLSGGLLLQMFLYAILMMLIGLGLGAAILLSAPAIVASFALPNALLALTNLISGLKGLGHWINRDDTLGKLLDHTLSGREWARVLTTLLLWLALPLAIGLYRFLRGEVR